MSNRMRNPRKYPKSYVGHEIKLDAKRRGIGKYATVAQVNSRIAQVNARYAKLKQQRA